MEFSPTLTRSPLGLIAATAFGLVVSVGQCAAAPPYVEWFDGIDGALTGQEWCDQWALENRLDQAQLVMVARVSNISAVKVVRGAKVDTTLREYRFQPVTVLKGVFTRDEIAMTDSDLGLSNPDPTAAAPFKHGEHILLILTRRLGSYGCVSLPRGMNNPYQLIPRLAGRDDPIVSMTQTMIQVSQAQSRQLQVELTIQKLGKSSGPAAIPLLDSLRSRGYWVQSTEAARLLSGLMSEDSPAVRSAAAFTVSRILKSRAPIEPEARGILAEALRKLLQSPGVHTQLRVAAIEGLGQLDQFGRESGWVTELLIGHLCGARTRAERAAAAAALGQLEEPKSARHVFDALEKLALDEPAERATIFIDAAVRLSASKSAPVLTRRLQQKLAAGHPGHQEIERLGRLKYAEAIPVLMQAATDGRDRDEVQLAGAFGSLGDDRAIPILTEWLADRDQGKRWAAVDALANLNADDAIAAIRLRLKSEPDLRLKLRMAEILGQHGIDDGYDFALEHLADPGVTPYAARALAAIGDERTAGNLWKILETSRDTQWSGAALQALAAMRDEKIAAKLTEILSDRRSRLLASALQAAQELSDPELIPAITPHVQSRNTQIVQLSISAVRHLAAVGQGQAAYRESIQQAGAELIKVLNEPDFHMNIRIAALDALQVLEDRRLPNTLRSLADRPQLENSKLLQRVNQVLTES